MTVVQYEINASSFRLYRLIVRSRKARRGSPVGVRQPIEDDTRLHEQPKPVGGPVQARSNPLTPLQLRVIRYAAAQIADQRRRPDHRVALLSLGASRSKLRRRMWSS